MGNEVSLDTLKEEKWKREGKECGESEDRLILLCGYSRFRNIPLPQEPLKVILFTVTTENVLGWKEAFFFSITLTCACTGIWRPPLTDLLRVNNGSEKDWLE